MPFSKDLFTVRRAALAAVVVTAVVAPSMALRTLTAKPASTSVEVGLHPIPADTTTTQPVPAPVVSSGAGSANPFGPGATAAPATVATVPPPPVTVAPVVKPPPPPPVTTTVPPPPSGPGRATSYAFSTYSIGSNVDKSPIRWSPSATVHYLINPAHAPAGAMADLTKALAMAKAATGLKFVYDGPTTVSTDNAGCTAATATTCWINTGPATPRMPGQDTGGFPPILIGWSPASAPIMASNATGSTLGRTLVLPRATMAAPVPGAGDFELVSGIVVFSSTATLPGGFVGSSRGTVMLHMLGQLVGLATVTDPDQMMFPSLNGHLAAYGAGDLAGLKIADHGVTYPVQPR